MKENGNERKIYGFIYVYPKIPSHKVILIGLLMSNKV